MTVRKALVLMAKAPEKGKVKTRLTPFLSGEDVLELYLNFLTDTCENMRLACPEKVICYHSENEDDFFSRNFPDFRVSRQEGYDLGERLKNIFKVLFGEGFNSVVAIGADTPHIAPSVIKNGFKKLGSGFDAVIGPCDDGGYYLIGLSSFVPEIFDGMNWGGDNVFSETVKKCRAAGLKTYILDRTFDIDKPDELMKFLNSSNNNLKSHIFLKILFEKNNFEFIYIDII